MSETKFTPGPWSVVEDMKVPLDDNGRPCGEEYINGLNIISGDDYIVCSEGLAGGNTDRANAHLIAAAPDLYNALENVMHEIQFLGDEEYYFGTTERFDAARAALSKARGES